MRSSFLLFIVILILASAAGCMAGEKIPVIMDIDNGPDDAIAVMMALKSEQFDVKAITITGDASTLDRCAIETMQLVEKIRPGSKIPVVRGVPRNLTPNPNVRVPAKAEAALPDVELDEQYAHDVIIDIISRQKMNSVVIIASGPLTNIATATTKNRGWLYAIKRLYWTGGCYPIYGNIGSAIEYGAYTDPLANKEVLGAGYPITTFGDPTMRKLLASDVSQDGDYLMLAPVGPAACALDAVVAASNTKSNFTFITGLNFDEYTKCLRSNL